MTGEVIPETAKDFAFMYPASHLIETSMLPIGLTVAEAFDMGPAAKTLITLVGTTIMVPGLDPLCILLGISYAGSSKFRAGVRKLRIIIFKIPKKMGLDKLTGWAYERVDVRGYLLGYLWSHAGEFPHLSINSSESEMEWVFQGTGETNPYAKLQFVENTSNTLYVHHFQVDTIELNRWGGGASFLKMLRPLLNGNAYDAIKDILKGVEQDLALLEREYHIETVEKKQSSVSVTFKPNTLLMRSRTIRSVFCERLLSGERGK